MAVGEEEWQKYKEQNPIYGPYSITQPVEYLSSWQWQVPFYHTICCISPTKISNRRPKANGAKDPANSVPGPLQDNQSANGAIKAKSNANNDDMGRLQQVSSLKKPEHSRCNNQRYADDPGDPGCTLRYAWACLFPCHFI